MTDAFFVGLLVMDVVAVLLLRYAQGRRSFQVAAVILTLPSATFLIWIVVGVGLALARGA